MASSSLATRLRFFAVATVIALLALHALVLPKDPHKIQPGNSFQSPSRSAWFGTDRLGRDVYSRTGKGLRNSIINAGVAELASFLTAVIVAVALIKAPRFINGAFDIFQASLRTVPALLPALTIAAIARHSGLRLITALYIMSLIQALPVFRAELSKAAHTPYAEGAVALGAPWTYVFRYAILPEVAPRLLRYATLDLASLVAFESLFGIVGLTTPPEPNLGEMLFESRSYMLEFMWLFAAPAGVLILTLMAAWQLRNCFEREG